MVANGQVRSLAALSQGLEDSLTTFCPTEAPSGMRDRRFLGMLATTTTLKLLPPSHT